MRKTIVVASLGGVALAGIAIAAAGGNLAKVGTGTVLLPASTGNSSPAAAVQPSPAALADGSQVDANGRIADSYICVFRAGAVGRGSERGEAMRSANAASGALGHVYAHALQGFSVKASARGIEQMQRNNPRIDYCEQDQVMAAIDPVEVLAKPGSGGGGTAPAEITPPGVTTVKGGLTTGFTGAAWVIDTGIDLDHPDLNVDVARSINKVSRETSPDDLNGHGSHVAGTIAGKKGNGIGTVGVAAGAQVIAVRVLNRRGSGSNSDVIAGVDHVAQFGKAGDVANMSLGGGVSDALDTAVRNAASVVKFALAAGNDGGDANQHSPARVDGTNIFTVAASNNIGTTWASFSNWGQPPVDYIEPGVSIFSTWKDGGYNTISGTSMATPHLAGLLLLGSVRVGGTVTRISGDVYDLGVH